MGLCQYATTNNHGLGVEGRGRDALSVCFDAKADRLNDDGGTGRNGRAEEEGEERVNRGRVEMRVWAQKNRCSRI